MKIISGHQPTYMPWLGLFHKLSLCDTFVYMDTVQYLEQDWNNRNKIRHSNGWGWLSVPIDRNNSDSSSLNKIVIKGHENPEDKNFWQALHWRSINVSYRKCKYFGLYEEELEKIYCKHVWSHLNDLCWAQFNLFKKLLNLEEQIIVRMSELNFSGVKDELVLDHCLRLNGDAVVFGEMGKSYVRPEIFEKNGIRVHFQKYHHPIYPQRFSGFEPYMSVLDLLMNLGPDSRNILLDGNISKRDLLSNKYWDF